MSNGLLTGPPQACQDRFAGHEIPFVLNLAGVLTSSNGK